MEGFCPLASGSKGNCSYLGLNQTKILIDIGITKSSLCERLQQISVSPHEINAIFISHEHTDHISGLKSFVSTYNIPVIANLETAKAVFQQLDFLPYFKIFSTGEEFKFGDFDVKTFSLCHDAVDPVGFVFHNRKAVVGICTDIGYVTPLIAHQLHNCNYLYLESNHDIAMVHNSTKSIVYKNRVLGKQGHLSNEECADLISMLINPELQYIYLAHLSEDCNSKQKALTTIASRIETSQVITIAEQYQISSPIYF